MIGRLALSLLIALAAGGQAAATVHAAEVPAAVSAGTNHTCALLSPGGGVACWGLGSNGQLGDGKQSTFSLKPVAVSGLAGATAVSAGLHHTCALLPGGQISCWGFTDNYRYVSGLTPSATPLPVPGVSGAIGVSAGTHHTCAVLATGGVQCWGAGTSGQLGDGLRASSAMPVAVSGISSAVAVSAGTNRSCAVLAGGGVQCWGRSVLGDGTPADSATPVAVSGIDSATAVSVGTNHTCAVLASGGVMCWGIGNSGEIGNGTNVDATLPAAVSGLTDAVAVSAGLNHACALRSSGGVVCWGNGLEGQLGHGVTRTHSGVPVAVSGMTSAIGISAGYSHSCALLANRVVQCWGSNLRGELGDGTGNASATPVTVIGLPPVDAPVSVPTATVSTLSGVIRVRAPGAKAFVPLGAASTLLPGTTIDATKGRVRLTTAAAQTGDFEGGIFAVSETMAGTTPLTVLTLAGSLPARCRTSKPTKRRLWADATGSFRTAGRYASATAEGTKWLTEDTCTGTLVRVTRGAAGVDDLVRHRTVRVSAGRSFLARAPTMRSFTVTIGRLVSRFVADRKRLASALDCSRSPAAARVRIDQVIANRVAISDELNRLATPTGKATTVSARLKTVLKHSIAADRHYRDWLAAGEICPLPQTTAFLDARRDDARATKAKRRFVAAFNPLARRERVRTWRANEL